MTPRRCARCGKKLSKQRQSRKYCYSCEVAVKREQAERAHRQRVCKTYGLLPGDYEKLLEAQGGRCAICRYARGVRIRLAVDHLHRWGFTRKSVRGLLCKGCNRLVGYAHDDPEFFRRAADYLENPPAWKVLQ